MNPQDLINQGRDWLNQKYPGYVSKDGRERRVLAAAWLCDVIKPREATGNNDGPIVEAILASVGLGKGYPWCAAAQSLIADVAGVWRPKSSAAAVSTWRLAAKNALRTISLSDVKRGDLITALYPNGTGHIATVLVRIGPLVYSIEGNTGPGAEGSQRDGQGMYRRVRNISFWHDAMRGE